MKGKGEYEKLVAKKSPKKVVKPRRQPGPRPRKPLFEQEIGGKPLPPVRPEKLNPGMTTPKGPLSFSMEHLLQPSGDHVLVVKAIKGSVTNKEEFIKEMAALDLTVVFLEYTQNVTWFPILERQQK